jgi:hypothetical protein
MLPAESVAIGDVEDLVLCSRRLARPHRGASQQVGGCDLVQRSICLLGTGESEVASPSLDRSLRIPITEIRFRGLPSDGPQIAPPGRKTVKFHLLPFCRVRSRSS